MEEGLAATAVPSGDDQMLQQIIDMLLAGADPEQLIQQGIPTELVRAAVEIIMNESPEAQAPVEAPASTAGMDMTGGLGGTALR